MLELLGKWHFLLELLNQEEVILELCLPGNGAIPVGKQKQRNGKTSPVVVTGAFDPGLPELFTG